MAGSWWSLQYSFLQWLLQFCSSLLLSPFLESFKNFSSLQPSSIFFIPRILQGFSSLQQSSGFSIPRILQGFFKFTADFWFLLKGFSSLQQSSGSSIPRNLQGLVFGFSFPRILQGLFKFTAVFSVVPPSVESFYECTRLRWSVLVSPSVECFKDLIS